MSEPPGLPTALGIEAVELVPEGGSLTVRVTGRWRRRRPEWRGPAILVVEAEGTRYRFPAMPEPPSLTGTMPGTWRMSFSVALELGPHLAGRSWLQLGSMVVPLPVFAESKLGGGEEGPGPSPVAPRTDVQGPADRPPTTGLAIENARRRAAHAEAVAAELTARIDQLELELEGAREEAARLERERWLAEQRAHAEAARRVELEEELGRQGRALDAARARVFELQQRAEELERDARRLRRVADEAAHLAGAERAARERAEQLAEGLANQPVPPPLARIDSMPPPADAARAAILRAERELAKGALRPGPPRPAGVPPAPPTAGEERVLGVEEEMSSRLVRQRLRPNPLPALLERERARCAAAEQRGAMLERILAERAERWARAHAEIDKIREEIRELRRAFAALDPGEGPAEESPAQVQAERLSEALARLKEETETPAPAKPSPTAQAEAGTPPAAPPPSELPAPSEPPAPPETAAGAPTTTTKPWLWPIFRALAREDPVSAGRLLLQLLPAWHRVHPLPVAGDLILAEHRCVQVTVGVGGVEVLQAEAPRDSGQVHFQVRGDLERLARTVAAGRLRRQLGAGMARISGDRAAFGRLALLVRTPRTLAELHAAGVRLDPELTLGLIARMIDPAWTVGERFTVAHRLAHAAVASSHLEVRDGAPVSAAEGPPSGEADTTIVDGADALLAVLTGRPAPEARLEGRPEQIAQLRAWIDRAQSA